MKNLSTAMTEIVKGNSARYYSKYVIDGKEHTETLNNFKFQNMINPNNEITIGNTCSSSVTFSIYMPTVSLENKEITIFEGVKVGTEIKYIQLGIFTVTKQTSDGEYTSYEAYDRMYKADMPYFSDMAFPNTDKAILNEICDKLGVSLATNIVTTHTISDKPQGYTYREIIGYMAMLQGCNAVINADGNLELRWYKDSGYVLDGHKYYQQGVTFTTSKDFIIEKLTCNNTKSGDKETSTITSGSGATGLSFANPFMTQAILDEVYKKIGGFQFRPLTVKFVGDWRLEVGDIITVSKGGVDYKVPIMQITHECDGGLMDTVTSIGQSDTENTSVASGPITKQMERYYADLITVNKALINKLDVDTAKITYATITNLTAVKGDVDYLKVNNLTVDKANLLYASIERMEVVEGQIRNLNVDDLKAQVANINTLMFGSASGGSLTTEFSNSVVSLIGDAQIKSAMIESIAADKITSGKIYTNLVEILSESGNLDIADNTIQIKDDNKVTRVQIGKDATNDYNIYVWDKSGNLMFDALGLTENGVKREIIRNDMIKEDANIAANKLNIESLFNVINEDGSHTLKSSKILIDDSGQQLNVAFKQITTNVESALSDIGTIKKSLNTVTDTISTQGTQITAIQGQISSKVWQQDITTAISEVQIGGRNLLLNTADLTKWHKENNITVTKDSDDYFKISTTNTSSWWSAYWYISSNKSEQTYTLSGYNKKGTKNGYVVVRYYKGGTNNIIAQKDVSEGYFTIKFTVPSGAETITVYLGLKPTSSGDYTYFKLPKLELGDKATDWTPAPEDVDVSISTIDTKVTTVSNQYTSLNQSLTSLTATVNSNTTKISEKADGSTVTALQANMTALTADLSGFKTTVSQTYTSKTEFNNLQIGGRNLLLNTADLTKWHKENNITVTKDSDDYFKISTTNTSSWWSAYWYISSNKSEQTYTLSGYNKKGTKNGYVVVRYYKGGTNNIIAQKDVSEGYFTIKFTVPSGAETITVYLGLKPTSSRDYTYFKLPKLELGDKATDWSPAPEDTDEKFTEYSTTTQMNSAINQSANSVLTTVSSNYATKASLELKVSKDKLISEINASADVITLKSNRFVLDSTNAKIAADGTVNFVQGTIAGWNISSAKLSGSAGLYGIAINKPVTSSTKVISINHIDTTAAATYVDDFYVRADGYTYIPDGYLSTRNNTVGGKGIEISGSMIKFFSWTDKDNFAGGVWSSYVDAGDSGGAQEKRQSLVVASDFNDELHLSYGNPDGKTYTAALIIDKNHDNKVHMIKPTVFHTELQSYNDENYPVTVNSNFSVGKKGTEKIARFWCYNGGDTTKSIRIFNAGGEAGRYVNNCEVSLWGTGRVQYNWHVNGTIYGNVSSDSDKNIKKDIQALDIEDSAHFIYSLIPSEFRFKNGTSNRLHHGLIAQDVKEKMGDNDWGLFIDKKVDDANYNETAINELTGEQTQLLTARYSLRYDELIADLIATVQSLNNRLKALEQ